MLVSVYTDKPRYALHIVHLKKGTDGTEEWTPTLLPSKYTVIERNLTKYHIIQPCFACL